MKALDIVIIPVTDQQKAKAFYLSIGFELVVEAPAHHGQTWIQLALPGQSNSIALMNFHGLIFETDDIEKEVKELKAKGFEVGKIDDQPYGRFAWLKDIDGNGLCLRGK